MTKNDIIKIIWKLSRCMKLLLLDPTKSRASHYVAQASVSRFDRIDYMGVAPYLIGSVCANNLLPRVRILSTYLRIFRFG